MKLRNKKTGRVIDLDYWNMLTFGNEIVIESDNGEEYCYYSLTELNEEWEDAEGINARSMPLIKDKRIRKAVRAWAEANKINKCKCSDEIHCITFETERGMFISFEIISFENTDYIPPEGNFTIAELCGEDEE